LSPAHPPATITQIFNACARLLESILSRNVDTIMPPGTPRKLLADVHAGNGKAKDQFALLLTVELQSLAERFMKRERVGHTFQPGDLVQGVLVRLLQGEVLDKVAKREYLFGTHPLRCVRYSLNLHENVSLPNTMAIRNASRCWVMRSSAAYPIHSIVPVAMSTTKTAAVSRNMRPIHRRLDSVAGRL
jgi:hypothetical protein